MSFEVHHICEDLHSRTNMFEMDAKYYLYRLARLEQSGFHPETTPILQLEADAGVLRQLANAIDEQRKQLTQSEKELKHA